MDARSVALLYGLLINVLQKSTTAGRQVEDYLA